MKKDKYCKTVELFYSVVTDLARFLGRSTSRPSRSASSRPRSWKGRTASIGREVLAAAARRAGGQEDALVECGLGIVDGR